MRRLAILVLILGFLAPALAKEMDRNKGKILLAGMVVTPGDGTKVSTVQGAGVEIVGTDWKTETNSDGLFVFTQAPDGEVTVKITKPGFQTVMRTAKVDKNSLNPPSFTVELLPEGMSNQGDSLTGRGTLYVAYSTKILDQSAGPRRQRLDDYDIRRRLIINDDPLAVVTHKDEANPGKRPTTSITMADNHVMIYPPGSPQRSTFFVQNRPIYYLAFDSSGQNLYVAGEGGEIRVFDETDSHEKSGLVIPPGKGLVTDLVRGDDGKYLYAAFASTQSGILVIDPQTKQSAAFLPLDNLGTAIPTCVRSGPPGKLLVTVSAPSQKGRLLIVDAYTGATEASIPVGAVPTCVSTTPDKRWGYVTNSQSGNVTVVDLQASSAIGLLPVGVSPQQCAVTPDGKRLLVTNLGSDTLSVVDIEKQRVAGFVRVGKEPTGLAVTPDSKLCYVSNREGGTISTVNLETLKQVYETDPMPISSPGTIVLRP